MFDYLERLRGSLMQTKGYIANKSVLKGGAWGRVNGEEAWVKTNGNDTKDFLFVVVGDVDPQDMQMGSLGDFQYELNNMDKARWSFRLRSPVNHVFKPDFRRGLFVVNILQGVASRSGRNVGVIQRVAESPTMLFVTPLFVPKISYDGTVGVVSDWPMGYGLVDRFRKAQERNIFKPLKVITKNGVNVPVKEWVKTVSESLVQVTFTIHRSVNSTVKNDVYRANPITIKVIKGRVDEKRRPRKKIKTKDVVDTGPIDVWTKGGSSVVG
ncbi:hypothetical protein EYR36_011466 [Pleurotus pulmonarius]|nr:hypothetical protein EYR36_011466 [Pleurotus pulmonarius]